MIPTGTKVYFAVAPTDLRKSFDGLSALAWVSSAMRWRRSQRASCPGDTLIATGTSTVLPALRHLTMSATTRLITKSPSPAIRPVSSATGMKRSGAT